MSALLKLMLGMFIAVAAISYATDSFTPQTLIEIASSGCDEEEEDEDDDDDDADSMDDEVKA